MITNRILIAPILFIFFVLLGLQTFSLENDSSKSVTNTPNSAVFFHENKGQVHDQDLKQRTDILYSGNVGGMSFHLKQNGIHYQLSRVDKWKEEEIPRSIENKKTKIPLQTTTHRLDISWPGANQNPEIEAKKPLPGFENYYLPSCPDGALFVKSYQEITYKKIYEGIDLIFHNKDAVLHYDFIVNPGADYTDIKILIKGAERIEKKESGDISIHTSLGEIIEGKPIVYQRGKQLEAKWIINGNVLSFNIEGVDPDYPIIIDPPVREWGTYYGMGDRDDGNACTTDKIGNVYMCGLTNFYNFSSALATVGAHQTIITNTSTDAFLVKFDSQGNRIWGTYYGGDQVDIAYSCDTDTSGNVYMAGTTSSTNLITTAGAHQTVLTMLNTSFLVKLDSNGIRQWGTYSGGSSLQGTFCNVSTQGNIFLVGNTTDSSNIATPGSYQTSMSGFDDAFLIKFNGNGVKQWGTYYGGWKSEMGYSCATDNNENVYMAGITSSDTVLATSGSHQPYIGPTSGFPYGDAFLVKFNTNGSRIWGTYYGGEGNDYVYSCSTDNLDNIYITGWTYSNIGIATPGAFQTSSISGQDGFIAKFNSNGSRMWGTYFGGNNTDQINSCSTDNEGNLYIVGITRSNLGISTPGSHQPNFAGPFDAFLAKFNYNGNRLWSTYYGGSGLASTDNAKSCATDFIGNVYFCGITGEVNGISTVGAFQEVNSGGVSDAYLVKFDCEPPSILDSIIGASVICSSSDSSIYTLNGFNPLLNYTWAVPSGATILNGQGTDSILVNFGVNGGNISVTAQNACGTSAAQVLPITINTIIPIPIVLPLLDTICIGDSTTLTATGGTSYLWNTGDTASSIAVSPSLDSSYIVTVSNNGCDSASSPINIVVNPTFLFSDTSIICLGDSLLIFGQYQTSSGTYYDSLQTISGCDSISWKLLIVNPSYLVNDSVHLCQGDSTLLQGSFQTTNGIYYDTLITIAGCDSIIITVLEITPTPSILTVSDTSFCLNLGVPNLTVIGSGQGIIEWYSDPNGLILLSSSSSYTPIINNEGQYKYYIGDIINGCAGPLATLTAVVYNPIALINPSEISGLAPLEVLFGNGSSNASWYNWNFGTGDTSTSFNPNYIFDTDGSYIVSLTVTDSFGCVDSVQVTIDITIEYVVSIPNTITPNGDGVNDFWIIDNIEQFPGHTVEVFNRNGSSVFTGTNYQNDWNGRYNGNNLPATTYYYMIDLGIGDGILKGDLTIIREK